MTAISVEMMKELLTEQAKNILSEIRDQIKAEVTIQLEPHISRITQLQNEQAQLRNQISELTYQMSTTHQQHTLPLAQPPVHPPPDHDPLPSSYPLAPNLSALLSIEEAKHTIILKPVSQDDLNRMKLNHSEMEKFAIKQWLSTMAMTWSYKPSHLTPVPGY